MFWWLLSRCLQHDLRLKLVNSGRSLRHQIVRKVMEEALAMWSDTTNLNFQELNEQDEQEADIWLKFVAIYHPPDLYLFDRYRGALAQAFTPSNNQGLSGSVHFDDSEY